MHVVIQGHLDSYNSNFGKGIEVLKKELKFSLGFICYA